MSYENGIPGVSSSASNLPVVSTNLGVCPTLPPITNSFSSDENDRPYQDVGYDGMDNAAEGSKFGSSIAAMQGVLGFDAKRRIKCTVFKRSVIG